MSKKFENTASSLIDSKPVEYAHIHWFMDRNKRKTSFRNPRSDLNWEEVTEEGELRIKGTTPDGLVYSLRNGWDASQGAVKCVPASKAEAEAAVKDRQRQIAEWERNPNTAPYATVARKVWFPNGKPAEVKYIGNEAYRRSAGVLGVLTRRALDTDYGDYSVSFLVPVVEVSFASEFDRLVSHVSENSGKDTGRSPLSEVDIFFIAKEMLQLAPGKAKESDLVRMGFKRGQAVKCFKLAMFDRKFPQLHIADRLMQPAPKKEEGFVYSPKCHLPMSKIGHQHLQKLANDFRYNESRNESQYKIRGGTQAKHVEEYFADVLRSAQAANTVMTQKELLRAMSNSPIVLLQWLASQVNAANREAFAEIEAHAERVNKALSFLDLTITDDDSADDDSADDDSADDVKSKSKSKQAASAK